MPQSRTTATDLAKVLDDGILPIYVLDDRRQIVYCNAACAEWTGVDAADLIGQICVYHTAAETIGPAAVAAGLCPPPAVFGGRALSAIVSCHTPGGGLAHRRGHFWPLGDGEDESAPVIAILEPQNCLPPGSQEIEGSLAAAPLDAELHDQVRRFRHQMAGRFRADRFIGASPAAVRARNQVELAAQTTANVLILGPSGAGKDRAAKAIHYCRRDPGPLVPLDCAVLESNLLRSTLRALRLKSPASKDISGTLLLNDFDCMAGDAQEDLAEMLRTGSLRMRVIATSAKPLDATVGPELFSRLLAFEISTITIELPALTERLEDLPLLAQALLEETNTTSTKQVGGFSAEALDQLAAYPWPGNIDELAAMVREAHQRARASEVTSRDLPNRLHLAADAASHPARPDEHISIEEFLARVEKELITRAMRRAKGNKSKAAKLLGLTRPRLYRRLVQLGLERPAGQDTG
jgi:DNA-binding NtrC family response regulator